MRQFPPRRLSAPLLTLLLLIAAGARVYGRRKPEPPVAALPSNSVGQLASALRGKAEELEGSSGMRLGFQSFVSAHKLSAENVRYSDYVVVRLLFEATRDAGIWQQSKNVERPSALESTATAECDELSALYAFLVERSGVRSVGLFWPAPNHTVAVWVMRPATGPVVRVVVPTSQIFLDENDLFDTKKFNPWRQKTIYAYTRRDLPDSLELPKPLLDFFLKQVDKYAGSSEVTLQQLRYLREGVFSRAWTPEQAAREALKKRSALGSGPSEDLAALQSFAEDMRSWVPH